MSAASDYARTRELRRKRAVPQPKKTMLLEVDCTSLDCRHHYMVELDFGTDYPETVKCPKCGEQADVTRLR